MSVETKYNKWANKKYTQSKGVKSALQDYKNSQKNEPSYDDSYAKKLEGIYGRLANRKDFDESNSEAYKQYASQARALSGLAISGNQKQAEGLTGGYGSTYANEVAKQGIERANQAITYAEPEFMLADQNIYAAETDRLGNLASTGADLANNKLKEYQDQLDIYNENVEHQYNKFNDLRNSEQEQLNQDKDFWSERYWTKQDKKNANREYNITEKKNKQDYTSTENQNERQYKLTENENKRQYKLTENQNARNYKLTESKNQMDYELDKYDVYNKIAANKCSLYNDNGDNSGMKAYLNALVKQGAITKYMADNLYGQYKVKSSSGSSGGSGSSYASSGSSYASSGSSGSGTSSGDYTYNKKNIAIGKGTLMSILGRQSADGMAAKVQELYTADKPSLNTDEYNYLMKKITTGKTKDLNNLLNNTKKGTINSSDNKLIYQGKANKSTASKYRNTVTNSSKRTAANNTNKTGTSVWDILQEKLRQKERGNSLR